MDALSQLEKSVLDALKRNARLSNDALSESLQQPLENIQSAIESLEKKHLILGYKAVSPADGHSRIRAFVELTVQPEKKTGYDTIAKRIYNYPEVTDHYLFSGAYDFLVVVEGDSHYDIASFVADTLATIEQVTSTVTHFVFKCYKLDGFTINQEPFQERLAIMA